MMILLLNQTGIMLVQLMCLINVQFSFMIYAIISMIFVVPIVAIIFWILSLIKFIKATKENKLNPDAYSTDDMQAIKKEFIITSVVTFILVAVIVGLVVTFALGIAYM